MSEVFLSPDLPPGVVTFEAIDFGAYTPRGYDPSRISGRIRGIAIKYFHEGQWLRLDETGSGTSFVFHDKDGKELGRAYKPSWGARQRLPPGPCKLTFVPTKT